MELALPTADLERYKSASQRARVATEAWAEANLFCPICNFDGVSRSAANTPAIDYVCSGCNSFFQLKSQSRPFSGRITDAAYQTMLKTIKEDRTPNLLALHYEAELWRVRNLILVPRFAFTTSVLEKRKPLGPRARRAGWIGCNIILENIPLDARIPIVLNGVSSSPAEVRRKYARLQPLANLSLEKRGWTLDVLNVVRSLGKLRFSLREAYASEDALSRLHPQNRHIREKIRQQLQNLRDLGFVDFLGSGDYRLR